MTKTSARVWRLLKDEGPLTIVQISERLKLPEKIYSHYRRRSASDALCWLKRNKLVKKAPGKFGAFRALGKKGPIGRGQAKGSKEALRLYSNGPKNLPKALIVQGRHIRPVATTALEQCWGWLPSSANRELRDQNDSAPISGGAVRPQEPEAA